MDIAEISLAAQVAWFEHLARRGFDSLKIGPALAVVTGVASNIDNGILVARATLADPGALDALIDFVRGRNVPASCVVLEMVEPELLMPLLERGLTPENDAVEMGLALDPARGAARALDPGIEIEEVTDPAALRSGLDAMRWLEGDDLERQVAVAVGSGYGPWSAVRHWIARDSQAVVGMATSFRFDDVVVLAQCGVIAGYRRRGIASALTDVRLAAAVDAGSTVAVLTPSPDGQLLHSRRGFRLVTAHPNRWFYLPYEVDDRDG